MAEIKKLDHVAVLVKDIDSALRFWRDTLGLDLGHIEQVASQEAKIAFFPLGESEIELVQPTTEDSGLARYLQKHGGGLHHLCFEVEDIAGKLAEIKAEGARLINETPLAMEDGRQIAFIHPSSAGGVLIELVQKA